MKEKKECHYCNGKGVNYLGHKCPTCYGEGTIEVESSNEQSERWEYKIYPDKYHKPCIYKESSLEKICEFEHNAQIENILKTIVGAHNHSLK